MQQLAEEHCRDLFSLLQTIPGISRKSALELIIVSGGDKNIRAMLYMCSMAAKIHNKGCRELYERMVKAGKAKKVALVAVMNKLLKQVFGIVNSGEVYCAEC